MLLRLHPLPKTKSTLTIQGHDKLFHGNLNIGGGGCGMYDFFQIGHEDQCYNNTFILGHPRPHATSTLPSPQAWADLRGCDATQQQAPRCGFLQNPYGGGAAPIMRVANNTVYVHPYLGPLPLPRPRPCNCHLDIAECVQQEGNISSKWLDHMSQYYLNPARCRQKKIEWTMQPCTPPTEQHTLYTHLALLLRGV